MLAISRHVRVFVEQKCGVHPRAQGHCATGGSRLQCVDGDIACSHCPPNAKIDNVVGQHGGAIKIKLRAQAVEGKANAALRCFLADQLNISQRAIILEHGQRSRDKLIRIDGVSEEDVRRALLGTNRNEPTVTR
jgi:uncharacterized protein (TIGR00251 family)